MERWIRLNYLLVAALIALLLLTRLPLFVDHLYEWDSIQFALGMEEYDVPLHQPHPPGYPFYVLAARAVSGVLHDANASLFTLSLIFSCLTILMVYALGRDMAGRGVAMSASVVLFFAPVFWLYGELSTTYAAEGMWSVLVALASYRASKGRAGWLFISAALLGVAGGFRGNIVLLLFPLWLYCALKGCRNGWKILLALLILGVSVISWLLPLFVLFGKDYIYASRLMYRYSNIWSVFVNPAGEWIINARRAVMYTFYGFGPLCWIVLLFLLATELRGRLRPRGGLPGTFFLWWVIPPFVYYLFLHFGKPGYALTYLPALALILGLLFCRRISRRGSAASSLVLAVALAWNLVVLFPPEGGGFAMELATGKRCFSLWRLDASGGPMEAVRFLRGRVDRRTAVLSVKNVHTRFASYYLPECYVYHADFVRIHPLLLYHDRRVVQRGEDGTISLLPGINEIVFIGDTESVAFDDPGLTSEEVCRNPRITIFRISPQFREVVYGQLILGEGMRKVRIRSGGEL